MTYWLWTLPPDVFSAAARAGTLALHRQGRARLSEIRPGDRIVAYLSSAQVVAGLFEAVGEPFEDATALVPDRHLPHRLRVRSLAVLPEELRVPRDGVVEHLRVLDEYPEPTVGARFRRVVQQVIHKLPAIDGKVLEFVVQARLGTDPDALMAAVEAVREARSEQPPTRPSQPTVADPAEPYKVEPFHRADAVERLIASVAARGFRYEPWEIAAYVTALRTKPFVLLVGVTGVGKSRLPVLVAEATHGMATVLPVRPDWTSPAETLGYVDLRGRFRPGPVLRAVRAASGSVEAHHILVLDEMNLGRPEHYFAEVLSRMEQRAPDGTSPPLLSDEVGGGWGAVGLPPALGIVGTVNVDESAHAFSRKVLDRAFVLELAPRDLSVWETAHAEPASERWPLGAWMPRATRLGTLGDVTDADREIMTRAAKVIADTSVLLAPAGLEVGYRVRDEVVLFTLHASEVRDAFRTRDGSSVDPLDVALLLKVLPRIDGARVPARRAVYGLFGWASSGQPLDERGASDAVERWIDGGRPDALPSGRFPRTAARLARIVEGALDDGVASFWA